LALKHSRQIGQAIQSIPCASSFRIGLAVFVQAGNVHELGQMLATLSMRMDQIQITLNHLNLERRA